MQSGGVTQDAHEEAAALLQELVHGIITLLFSQGQKYVYLLLSVCEVSTLHVKLRIDWHENSCGSEFVNI